MCNSVTIPESVAKNSDIGDEVDVKIRGIITEEHGERKIDITHVDGKAVESMEEECGSCGKPHHGGELPSSDDALMTFIKVIKPKK